MFACRVYGLKMLADVCNINRFEKNLNGQRFKETFRETRKNIYTYKVYCRFTFPEEHSKKMVLNHGIAVGNLYSTFMFKTIRQ